VGFDLQVQHRLAERVDAAEGDAAARLARRRDDVARELLAGERVDDRPDTVGGRGAGAGRDERLREVAVTLEIRRQVGARGDARTPIVRELLRGEEVQLLRGRG